jgi:hypothetical protein
MIQGFIRHSDDGVMQKHWEKGDFRKMAWKPLSFTEQDIRLIHHGLDQRAARLHPAKSDRDAARED